MSAPQVQHAPLPPSPQASVPRKRRRRAPTTGAADDCFTCAGSSLKCDRRRPYCSQCLQDGKECSGYKTTLTWGVGVASRGKLRGLSLPVAGGQKAGTTTPIQNPRKRKASNSDESMSHGRTSPSMTRGVGNTGNSEHKTARSSTDTKSRTFSASPGASGQWIHHQVPSQKPSLQILQTPCDYSNPAISDSLQQPVSATSISGFGESEIPPPMAFAGAPQDATCYGMAFQQPGKAQVEPHNTFDFNAQMQGSWNQQQGDSTKLFLRPTQQTPKSHPTPTLKTEAVADSANGSGHQLEEDDDIDEISHGCHMTFSPDVMVRDDSGTAIFKALSNEYGLGLSPFTGTMSIGKTPRMQYLINYYAEVISPVIVAFDSPSNPYRTHILQLAAGSETLQHAISALSASNLRQRRGTGALSTGKTDPARRSSMAHLTLTVWSWQPNDPNRTEQEQAREETFHKAFSIQSLNAQLADPAVRKDDSILATLLILCLFHICDSGVAKFKTQFAGVKKLLCLRGNDLGNSSRDTKWFTRMFTWFDAMTATVNDREGQLGDVHLDMSAMSDEEWALENLAGCDGKLFRTIARLGRLNVLNQSKPVEEDTEPAPAPRPVVQPFSNFDGNGWSQVVNDDDLYASKEVFTSTSSDVESQFWTEWRSIRQDLQTWSLDTSLFDSSSSEASLLTADQRMDLANISESFRYSALLYTERLASPSAASSDGNIQAWVQQALEYIKMVRSDVFLLWPLFITGSECATEADRMIIRERCLDIQKDSGFFNNQSCLELLEKVWQRYPANGGPYGSGVISKSAGFKFSDVMRQEKNEGEYIVV